MTAVVVVCAVLLTAGAAMALVRAERGPSMLDRTVALDIIVTVVVAAVALYASVERRTDVVPILVVLSLVGFVGSVTISRFASVEPEGEGRVRTREEIAQEEAERIRAEERAEEERRARRAREAEAPAHEGPGPVGGDGRQEAATGARAQAGAGDTGEDELAADARHDAEAAEAGMHGPEDDGGTR